MYAADGTASLTEWITLRAGEGQPAAAHDATLARGLPRYPGVSAALADGRISAAHAAWLLALARLTDAGDADLVDLGEKHTVTELRAAGRTARRLTRTADEAAHARRYLRWRADDAGTVVLHGRLHGADGLTVTTALSALAETAPPDPAAATPDPFDTRCADALVEICTDPRRARPEVVIHVPITALTDTGDPDPGDPDPGGPDAGDTGADPQSEDTDPDDLNGNGTDPDPSGDDGGGGEQGAAGGVGASWDGTPISAGALRRLLCDSGLRLTVDDAAGRAVGIGRRSRAIPDWLESQLRWRDGGCRFPGCEHTHWLHGHHLVHWPDGGRTDLSNLTILCGAHHRYLHEGGWRLTGDPDGELTFTSPTEQTYTSHPAHRPPPRRRRLRRRPPNTRSGPRARRSLTPESAPHDNLWCPRPTVRGPSSCPARSRSDRRSAYAAVRSLIGRRRSRALSRAGGL